MTRCEYYETTSRRKERVARARFQCGSLVTMATSRGGVCQNGAIGLLTQSLDSISSLLFCSLCHRLSSFAFVLINPKSGSKQSVGRLDDESRPAWAQAGTEEKTGTTNDLDSTIKTDDQHKEEEPSGRKKSESKSRNPASTADSDSSSQPKSKKGDDEEKPAESTSSSSKRKATESQDDSKKKASKTKK